MEKILFEIEKQLESDKKSVQIVEPLFYDIRKKVDIPDEKFYNLLIAVTEALNNAICHGNDQNPDKKVYFHIKATGSEIQITIQDEGSGFNHEEVADPRQPENLMKASGRGVFLIKTLMDEVNYQSGPEGTTLRMVFLLS